MAVAVSEMAAGKALINKGTLTEGVSWTLT